MRPITYAFVGNPNSGKTSLFNQLTGERGKIGNYAGVTVERRDGFTVSIHGKPIRLIDLPGAYSLNAYSPEEAMLASALLDKDIDGIVYVADATKLQRSLYFFTQVQELQKPMIVVLRMVDVAKRLGIVIDIDKLSQSLGCRVVACPMEGKQGILSLRVALSENQKPTEPLFRHDDGLESLLNTLDLPSRGLKIAHLWANEARYSEFLSQHPQWKTACIQTRYDYIKKVLAATVTRTSKKRLKTESIDRVLLHPIIGLVAFFAIMGSLFWAVFTLSKYPVGWIQSLFGLLATWVEGFHLHSGIQSFLIDGALGSIGNVVVFLPQILILFFFLSLLESTGYLPRGAFLVDRCLRIFGLQGKAFIPLLSCYGCTIPGIMGTRCMRSAKERLATIFVSPWLSCSARLPVYIILISILLPSNVSNWMKTALLFAIYALTTLAALLVSFVLRKTLLRGQDVCLLGELPKYQKPPWILIASEMWEQTFAFLKKAGTLILFFSLALWGLMHVPYHPHNRSQNISESVAGQVGRFFEPALKPLGYDWKIGIGILSSFFARETFISTMSIIYGLEDDNPASRDLHSLMLQQKTSVGSPVYSIPTCISLLLFFAFAQQCFTTLAVVYQETKSLTWAISQFLFMTVFAYGVAWAAQVILTHLLHQS